MKSNPLATLILKPKREKSVRNRHPWIFSGAVARIEGAVSPGETIDIVSADGRWLACGAWSPHSQIRSRIWTFDRDETIDPGFFYGRLKRAIDLRQRIMQGSDTNALRLVNGESDGLPGLIVDRYDSWLVGQFLTAGTEHWKATIVNCLSDLVPERSGIYDRSDVDVRRKEGLKTTSGRLDGEVPPELVDIVENGCRYRVDIKRGHKTGFYLDQRENRAILSDYAHGADVLNCFAYTGGFAVAALRAGAKRVSNVDTSASALELARTNMTLNNLDAGRADFVAGDVFDLLRRYQDSGRRFDLVVLDPPKFVQSRNDLMRASRGYKDINRLAFGLLHPGGILFTFSCSGLMGHDLFQKIVFDAALDAGRQAVILKRLSQSPDHPIGLNFPEGSYLKGLVCHVI